MTKQEITNKIYEIVCNKFMVGKKEITLDSTFYSLGADSLDLVEVIDDIEKKFKINIPDNIALKIYTITSTIVADYITSIVDYVDMIVNKKINNAIF